ncbi:hypothetical protein J6590_074663 [Homalodisca vitripennis]|nr:hypothetical protein J6590_074663 [Homalodisca vitripennis]
MYKDCRVNRAHYVAALSYFENKNTIRAAWQARHSRQRQTWHKGLYRSHNTMIRIQACLVQFLVQDIAPGLSHIENLRTTHIANGLQRDNQDKARTLFKDTAPGLGHIEYHLKADTANGLQRDNKGNARTLFSEWPLKLGHFKSVHPALS